MSSSLSKILVTLVASTYVTNEVSCVKFENAQDAVKDLQEKAEGQLNMGLGP